MLGTFHTIMMFMAIIYKRFKDAGLKDVMIQSGVLAEGSVDQALSGKMYNRGIRAYKLMYEALLSIFLENMEEYYENDLWNISFIQDGKAALEELAKDPCDETYQQFSNSKDFKSYYHLFLDYKTKMRSDGSQLTQFWITFLDMVEVLLNTVYATRAGRWVLLLESYRDIIPYTFAYDHLNYAKYLTSLLAELVNLDQSHPDVYQEFMIGNFSAQLSSNNSFGRTELDKMIEVTINKDTKCPGGLKGFSTSIDQVNRWTLNATHRADMCRCLQDHLHHATNSDVHHDLRRSRIAKDIQSVTSIVDVLKNTFVHPFMSDINLVSISSGLEATQKVADDLLNAKKIGQQAMEKFIKERLEDKTIEYFAPVKKTNLATFKNLVKVVKVSVKQRMIPLRYHRDIFGQISIIMQKRDVGLRNVLAYLSTWATAMVLSRLGR